jgi:hypothetical protein
VALLDLLATPKWAIELKARLDVIYANQQTIMERQGIIMALVQVDQTVLDAIGTELGNVADAVQAIVDNPSVPLEAADLTGITAPVSRLQELLTKPEEPVDPPVDPPVEDPTDDSDSEETDF